MIPSPDIPPGYYLVQKGRYPSGQPAWRVARWMPQAETWELNSPWFDHPGHYVAAGYFDDIGTKVA